MHPTVILEIIFMRKVNMQFYTHFADTWINYIPLAECILLSYWKHLYEES